MNRRNFIASLVALPAGLMAAAQASPPPQLVGHWEGFTYHWFQTDRLQRSCTMEYEDMIDAVFTPDETTRRWNWHERRKDRSRSNIALLATQRPLPL